MGSTILIPAFSKISFNDFFFFILIESLYMLDDDSVDPPKPKTS